MNRRQFLKRGVIGGALLSVAGLALYPSRERGVDAASLRHLSPRGFAILCAVAARIVPHVADPTRIVRQIDVWLDDVAPDAAADVNKLLLLFDNALFALIFDGRLSPFSRADGDAQDAVLTAWRDSRVTVRRSGYQVLRRLCLGACYADTNEQRGIGYQGPRRIPGLSFDDSKMGTREWLAANTPPGGKP
ncbi:MAG: hypothetical protein IT381_22625 [Deltaproteobacteria bacterium]|nr:hypothetical protein [Deltaproteobacteria bacterium]